MAFATSDRMAMRYIREDSFGVPASGPLSTLVITSENLVPDFQTTESESTIGDRQVREVVRTGRMSQGDINFELIHGNIDDLLTGALADEWASDVLENASDMISFAFEKDFADIGVLYALLGCRVGGLSLNFPLADRITGALNVMGKGAAFESGSASIGVGTPGTATSNEMMVTLESLDIEEGGVGVAAATGFSFATENGLRNQRVLGATDLAGIGLGTFRVTGTLDAYFEDTRYVDKLIADSESDFEITTQDSDGNAYVWTFPRFKFTGLSGANNPGRNQDVPQTLQWTAYRDPSTGITMRIER